MLAVSGPDRCRVSPCRLVMISDEVGNGVGNRIRAGNSTKSEIFELFIDLGEAIG